MKIPSQNRPSGRSPYPDAQLLQITPTPGVSEIAQLVQLEIAEVQSSGAKHKHLVSLAPLRSPNQNRFHCEALLERYMQYKSLLNLPLSKQSMQETLWNTLHETQIIPINTPWSLASRFLDFSLPTQFPLRRV